MDSASALSSQYCSRRWERRILRARELQGQYAAAAAPLRFYEEVLGFQRRLAEGFGVTARSGVPLREQIELAFVLSSMPRLLLLVSDHGPEVLRLHAQELLRAGESELRRILEVALPASLGLSPFEDFIARASLQPIAENLQSPLPTDSNWAQSVCPACGGFPQLAILRPEGEGASRWLLCSFCLREWLFRRVICPWCKEEDKEKLPRYSSDQCSQVHVQACDTCKRYLKGIDLSVDGRAVPLVDEAALAVLDVWATDHGYSKIVRNLLGF